LRKKEWRGVTRRKKKRRSGQVLRGTHNRQNAASSKIVTIRLKRTSAWHGLGK